MMKKNAVSSILLTSLFYTTLLSTTFVMPLLLARDNAIAVGNTQTNTQTWDRAPNARAPVKPQRDLLLPQSDVPASGAGAKQAPIDKSGPDAGMIKAGKVRVKTIKA
jgi:hypothetical protein